MRELWRLRLNFCVLLVISFMGGIGYSSVLSSLHQFVTNPTLEKLNGTEKVCVRGIIQLGSKLSLLVLSESPLGRLQ